MISVDRAVNDYARRCAVSTLDIYPLVWAGHYSDRLLGEYGIPVLPEVDEALSKVVFGCIVPFGYSSVIRSTFTIIDAYRAAHLGYPLPKAKRVLYVSRLAQMQSGVLTTHWVVPYRIDDFETVYGEPEKTSYYIPKVAQAFSMMGDKRLEATFDIPWDEAEYLGRHQLQEIFDT